MNSEDNLQHLMVAQCRTNEQGLWRANVLVIKYRAEMWLGRLDQLLGWVAVDMWADVACWLGYRQGQINLQSLHHVNYLAACASLLFYKIVSNSVVETLTLARCHIDKYQSTAADSVKWIRWIRTFWRTRCLLLNQFPWCKYKKVRYHILFAHYITLPVNGELVKTCTCPITVSNTKPGRSEHYSQDGAIIGLSGSSKYQMLCQQSYQLRCFGACSSCHSAVLHMLGIVMIDQSYVALLWCLLQNKDALHYNHDSYSFINALYIYIYIYVCVCVCVFAVNGWSKRNKHTHKYSQGVEWNYKGYRKPFIISSKKVYRYIYIYI